MKEKNMAEGYTTLLRTMTKKSVVGFGRYRDLSISEVLIEDPLDIASMYYGCGKISFTDDVLKEVGIEDEWLIDKPSERDWDRLKEFKNYYYSRMSEKEKMSAWSKAQGERRRKARIEVHKIDRRNSPNRLAKKNQGKFII